MPEILKISADRSEEDVITSAAAIISRGGVIAYPTETIYGLGADATNEQAIRRIFEIKGRDFANPISVIIGNPRDIYPLVREVTDTAQKLMETFWPGPLTIVFKSADGVLPLITANTGKIGIRLTSHEVARQIAAKTGKPLTATSANLSGAQECASASEVAVQLGDKIDAIIDLGNTSGTIGSTIIDITCAPLAILREGAISRKTIEKYLNTSLKILLK
ncbi:MAG TPA: L-threonylcarbamoyladenylate synthase [Smithellaceae bacterium]|nr:L-threonylcarbamoyladenylate synthase [Smithellaceae bacterium]